jgi:hypothetical protein
MSKHQKEEKKLFAVSLFSIDWSYMKPDEH